MQKVPCYGNSRWNQDRGSYTMYTVSDTALVTKGETRNNTKAVLYPDNYFSEETYENATLYVPEGSVEKYRTTEGWRNFIHIMEIGETGICNLKTDIKPFDIYDVKGHKVRTAATTLDNLPKGIYIVNGRKMMK